ncbi:hypothetical protein HK405_010902 [Cladochytrium tenue]|nr:hypothetical protein HK405_010902 [Cladochytrium tenue]
MPPPPAQLDADAGVPTTAPPTTSQAPPPLTVSALRRALPPHVFKKDVARSHLYLIFDATAVLALLRLYATAGTLSWAAYLLFYAPVLGLAMWCLFVVGHDAGHGTFSESAVVNAVVGHAAHGFLLVPFWPWAHSHALHHAFHNHKDKDRSHVWFDVREEGWDAVFKDVPLFIPFEYGIGYLFLGYNDGSHYWPFSKLHATTKDRVQCAVSALVCLAFLAGFVAMWGRAFWGIYFGPWLVFNTWLYAVTYLQHHADRTRVFAGGAWTFLRGALETVDRVYDPYFGVLDDVMHNITDGHLAHHLFSTSIPHYNLKDATRAIRPLVEREEERFARALAAAAATDASAGTNGDATAVSLLEEQEVGMYRHVEGFPLLELLRDHWRATRRLLVPKPTAAAPASAKNLTETERWVFVSPSEWHDIQAKQAAAAAATPEQASL